MIDIQIKKYKVVVDDVRRHRITALSKMGEKSFPAYIMKSDLKDLKEILNEWFDSVSPLSFSLN